MADIYSVVLTTLGEAKFAQAVGTKSVLDLVKMGIGDGRGADIVPNKSMTKMVRETWRGDIGVIKPDPLNPNLIIIETTVPPNVGGFTVREVGIYDTVGDLIVIASYPSTFKPIQATGADKTLVIRLTLTFTNPSNVKAVTIFDYKTTSIQGIKVHNVIFKEGIITLEEGCNVRLTTDEANNSFTINAVTPDWEPLTEYPLDATVVVSPGKLYRCIVAHTSSINFLDNIDGYWEKLGGSDLGPITADMVGYTNVGYPDLINVELALHKLLYSPPGAPSLTNTVGTVEIGSIVDTVVLNWTYTIGSKPIVSQIIDSGVGSQALISRSCTLDNLNLTTNKTFKITISDGTTLKDGSTTVAFSHRRYWGVIAKTSITDADILTLNKEFSVNRAKSINGISPTGQYIYYAYPAAWGPAVFTVNGLLNTDWILSQMDFTNASGLTTLFKIYRSGNLLTGSYNLVIS